MALRGTGARLASSGDRYQSSALQGWQTGGQIRIPTHLRHDLGWLLSARKPGTTLVLSRSVLRDCISAPL